MNEYEKYILKDNEVLRGSLAEAQKTVVALKDEMMRLTILNNENTARLKGKRKASEDSIELISSKIDRQIRADYHKEYNKKFDNLNSEVKRLNQLVNKLQTENDFLKNSYSKVFEAHNILLDAYRISENLLKSSLKYIEQKEK